MPTAYSYIRFSTPAQADGDSLRRQIEPAREYAAEHGLDLDESFRDLGVSAYEGKNKEAGALGRFLRRVKRGDVEPGSILIVESLDRLSREETVKALRQFLDILEAGIEIVTLIDGQRYTNESVNNPGQIMISIVYMSQGHEESAKKSKRGRATWEQKRKDAAASKKPLTACCPSWLKLSDDRSHYVIVQNAAAVIRRIYRDADRGMGQTAITQALNREGVPNIGRAKTWSESSVHSHLSNPAVIGEYQPHKGRHAKRKPEGDPIPGYYPAIIDEALFHRVQAAREQRRVAGGGRAGKRYNALQKIAFCAECGTAMLYIDKRGRKEKAKGGMPYLVCGSVHRGTGCTSTARPKYVSLETAVLFGLRTADVDALAGTNASAEAEGLRDELATVEGRLHAAESALARWIEIVDNGPSPTAEEKIRKHEQEIAEFKKQRRALKRRQKQANASATDTKRTIDAILSLHERMRSIDGDQRIAARAELSARLRELVKRVECGQSEAVVIYKSGATEAVTLRAVKKTRDTTTSLAVKSRKRPNTEKLKKAG